MGVLAIQRKQITHTFPGANQVSIQQLNKSLAYRDIALTLTGAPTLAASNNTVAQAPRGDEWGVLKKIRLIANSSDVLLDITGDQLWWLNRYWYGIKPEINTQLGDSSTANPVFSSTLLIPLWMTRSRKPLDTLFDSGGLTDFRFEITWGTFTDMGGTNATAFTANPTLQIASHENELTPAFYPPLIRRTIAQQQIVTGSSSAFRFPLDVGPMYRGFLINATTNASPAVDSSFVSSGTNQIGFSNVRLVSGSTIFFDLDEATLYDIGQLRNAIPYTQEKIDIAAPSPTNITSRGNTKDPRINPNADERAWYNLDLVTDGYLSECINTGAFNEFYLEFNIPGTTQLQLNVISHQLLANNRAPQNQG